MTYAGKNEWGALKQGQGFPFPQGPALSRPPAQKTALGGCSTAGRWTGRMRSQTNLGRQVGRWAAVRTTLTSGGRSSRKEPFPGTV